MKIYTFNRGFAASQNGEWEIETNPPASLTAVSLPISPPYSPEQNTDFWLSPRLTLFTVGNQLRSPLLLSQGSVTNPAPDIG